jgi:hypothetical protein
MPKLGGWHRLWIVLSVIYVLPVAWYSWHRYQNAASEMEFHRILPRPEQTSEEANLDRFLAAFDRQRRRVIVKGIFLWLGPVVCSYPLALSARWVYRGFKTRT